MSTDTIPGPGGVALDADQGQDSSPDKSKREYVVLEEESLAEVVDRLVPQLAGEVPQEVWDALEAETVYTKVGTGLARNTQHALQLLGRRSNNRDGEPTLVPIAARHFRREQVHVDRSPRVRVG